MRKILLLGLLLTACAPSATIPAPRVEMPSRALVLPRETHWFRNAAEYQAVALGTYRAAADRITELADGRAPGSWGVILDADETVLDNSEYQKRLAMTGGTFSGDSWNEWVSEVAAPAIPGALEFLETVEQLGGRVAIVTNRDDVVCDATRENLERLGVEAELVLCRVNRVSDKNPRYTAIEEGTAAAGVPAMNVLMWIGDNIQDFPRLTQAARAEPAAFALFGDRYFMLPNPMYGSFEQNPHN